MKIKDKLKQPKPLFSFEVFPPRPDMPVDTVYNTIEQLKILHPDFISVTYGAGGGNRLRTIEISSRLKNHIGIEALSHLTCVSSTANDIDNILDELQKENIENILALRGDAPKNIADFDFSKQEFQHASDLISHISKRGSFCIGAACYPEGHIESTSKAADIENLKLKVEAGVDFLLTQLFLNNDLFYSFLENIRKSGIDSPVIAGIMPIYNTSLIKKMTIMCGASIPKKLVRILNKYENNPAELYNAGIHYAVEQINGLVKNGIDGIHLYTMNKAEMAKEIISQVTV